MPGSLKQIGRIDYAITGFDTPFQKGDLGGPFKWGKIGKYDENGNLNANALSKKERRAMNEKPSTVEEPNKGLLKNE